jgi:uncharacterized protein (UPF0264 family)
MTGMLASVMSLEEAALVLAAKVDIIDLKQPASGALGALDLDLVKQIVKSIQGQCPVSATIGDLPMQPDIIFKAVKAMSETGVDYIKIGCFPGNDSHGTVARLQSLAQQNQDLIAVLFADKAIDFTLLDSLKISGFKGVMLDTMHKNKGSLTEILEQNEIERFVCGAKSRQLLCGLAGSLRLTDIPELLALQPDYLGFRGALCEQHNRTATLSKAALAEVKEAVYLKCPGHSQHKSDRAIID